MEASIFGKSKRNRSIKRKRISNYIGTSIKTEMGNRAVILESSLMKEEKTKAIKSCHLSC
uniref:Uncharacterized protein n=1 Tax=Rhizophora mucronata TaxID=61149 RepID=A0A2P2K8U5_RHIMU